MKEYIALRPDDKFGYVQQAHVLADLADFNGSNEVLAELLKRYPGLREAYAERGVNFLNLNRFDSCIVNLGRGLGVSSKLDSMIYRDRAVAYSRSGNFASALEDFDAAAKFNPTDSDFYYDRALVKISLGRHQSAILDLSECLRIDPKNHAAINARAECYFMTKQFDKAAGDCNTGLKWWEDDPFLLFRRAHVI